jgi:drug/metabolite transporter (DMT)-like permease
MHERPGVRDFLILAGLSLIWGTSYILIKWGLVVFTPYQVATLRLGISALALLPLVMTHLRRIRLRQLPLLFAVGVTGTALPSFLFPVAQTYLSSSLTGMLSSLTPLCTFLVGWLIFRNRPVRQQLAGIALGLAGAILLAYVAPGAGGATTQLAYASLVLGACLCYGISSNLVAQYFRETPSLTITVVSFFLVGLPALLWSVVSGEVVATVTAVGAPGLRALLYVGILAVGSTVLASLVFFRLVQRTGAVFASTVSYLIPLVALGWGLADGEAFGWLQAPGVLLVLLGVYLSKRK